MTAAYASPDFPHANPEPDPEPEVRPPYVHCMPKDPKLRIGDRVRCTKGDWFISFGMTGIIVNVAPPRYNAPARARVLWDNGCVSMLDEPDFRVVPSPTTKRMQPVIMGPFWREGWVA